MGFTKDTSSSSSDMKRHAQRTSSSQYKTKEQQLTGTNVNINKNNIFAPQDYVNIINAFESGSADWEEEDYSATNHYKDVYSTKQFSKRVQDQLDQYPGLHQSAKGASEEDPFYTAGQRKAENNLRGWENSMTSPGAFMGGLRSRQQDFDYAKIFGSQGSATDRAKELGKMHTECIPCFKRLLDINNLLPNGDIIEMHLMNVNIRLDFLKDLKDMFSGPGMYLDICELLKLLAGLCPSDLFALSVMLSQFLAKLNLEIKFNLDFIISLVGSMLSPFLDALSQWLDKWMQLIIEPMICVVDHINETIFLAQNAKIPFSQSKGGLDVDLNIANIGHNNATLESSAGYDFKEDEAWAGTIGESFDTPDNEKYNTPVPTKREEYRASRIELDELREPYFIDKERREEQTQKVHDKNAARRRREREEAYRAAKNRNPNGSRWSKDDIPPSEKTVNDDYMFRKDVAYPERQKPPKSAQRYWTPDALVSGVVQIRNIAQTSISYINDWFTYISQMIYDLLGTEIGWMKNKSGTTKIKTDIIQILKLIKSIIQAISKNSLRCGTDSNLDPSQMKYIVEKELSDMTPYDFSVKDNGDVQIDLPGKSKAKSTSDKSSLDDDAETPSATETVSTAVGDVNTSPGIKQSSQKSSILVKSCFSKTDVENVQKVQKWIDYYERRLANEVNTQ